MSKRMILMLAAAVTVIVALGSVKYGQVRTAIAQASSFQPPPEAVTTIVARQEAWATSLSAIATVNAVQGVTVSADLPGIVARIAFESGRAVGKGDVLVVLDTSQERAQLAAAEAARDLARLNFERHRGLVEKGVTSRADFDRWGAELKQAEARVNEILATIDRKTIRAPFSGTLGIRQVDLGQYLDAGDPIVPLQSLDPIYVDFAVPQQAVAAMRPGATVEVSDEGGAVTATGRVSALDSVVDEATRNVRVQAVFDNRDGLLRPGMFVEARVTTGAGAPVVALPVSAISYAPYGDSVFVVEDLAGPDGATYRGARQQFVKLGPARGDQVAVISGVEAGAEIVTSGVFKLRNGAAVHVDNQVQPANSPAPTPENS
jgi:membrane fusion protein (multidrug efflux system)